MKQLTLAVQMAVLNFQRQRLRSNDRHREILYALAQTRNMNQAFERHGISDSTRDIIVVVINADAEDACGLVEGDSVEDQVWTSEGYLWDRADVPGVLKDYKMKDSGTVRETVVNSILARMSTKELIKKK